MSVLEMENVAKAFDGVKAVDHLSLGFERGKITGIIGPNGAGKSTVFNLICGLSRPDAGQIGLCGRVLNGLPSWQVARAGVGRLFQDVRVFRQMTVLDNVLASFPRGSSESPLLAIFGRARIGREERQLAARARQLLALVGIAQLEEDLADTLSFGQQKLLAIVRLLAANADVLLLDEPTAGVNPARVAVLVDVIRRLAADGRTVVIIEHNLNVIIEVADWVYFMDEGRLRSFGRPAEVLADPEVKAAYVGL